MVIGSQIIRSRIFSQRNIQRLSVPICQRALHVTPVALQVWKYYIYKYCIVKINNVFFHMVEEY